MSDDINITIGSSFNAAGVRAAERATEGLGATTKRTAREHEQAARAMQRASRETLAIAQAHARAEAASGNYTGAITRLNRAMQQAEVVNVKQGLAIQAQIARYQQAAQAATTAAGAQTAMAQSSAGLGSALSNIINPATLAAGALAAIGAAAVEASNNQRALEQTQNTLRALAGSQELYNTTLEAARTQQKLFGGSLRENIDGLTGLVTLARSTGAEMQTLIDISQRLSIKDPSQGIAGARIALQEALTGDPTSLARRYEIPRAALKALRDESTTTQEKLAILDTYLSDIGITSDAVSGTVPVMTERINQLGAAMDAASAYAGTMINGLLEMAIGSDESGKFLDDLTKNISDTATMYQRMFDLMGEGIPIHEAFGLAVNYVANQADNLKGSMDKAANAVDNANSRMLTWLNLQGGAAGSALSRMPARSTASGGASRKPTPAPVVGRRGGGGTSAIDRAQREYETALDRAADAEQARLERQEEFERDLARKQADAAESRAERLAGIETDLQDRLTGIRADAAQKQADLETSTAERLTGIRKALAQRIADIERQQQEQRRNAARSLESSIANATAGGALAAELADVTEFSGGGKADQDRQAAQAARQQALAAAAAEAQGFADPTVGAAAFQARQQQISTLEQLDKAYAEKRAQYAGDPRASAALAQQYEEAKAAAEAMVQLTITEAQTAADLRAEQAQREIEEARKAAEAERRAVVEEKRKQTEEIAREAQTAAERAILEAQRQRDEVAKSFADQQEAITLWAEDTERNLQKVIDKADEAAKALKAIKAPGGGGAEASTPMTATTGTGKAIGGPVGPGLAYPVGGRGMEWFYPRERGFIAPANAAPGGGGIQANITIQGGGMSPQTIADSVIRELDRRMRTR